VHSVTSLPAGFFEELARPPFNADPHPRFDALRSGPLPRLTTGEIILVNHSDALVALRDSRFEKPSIPTPPGPMRVLSKMFLLIDGGDHQRLRRAVSPLFSPAAADERNDEIRAEARTLLQHGQRLDVIDEYANRLPLRLTGRWLGVSLDDQPTMRTAGKVLTDALDAPVPTTLRHTLRFISAVITRRAHPIASARAVTALARLARLRLAGADAGRCPDGAAFLDQLSRARKTGEIDDDEAVATWILLLVAGYETTANLIGTAAHHLLARPELLEQVRSDLSLVPSIVEEALRFDSPVPVTARRATDDVDLPGGSVRAGQTVIVVLTAANRDPDVFDDPNRFDIERDTARHLGFAHGAHFCLGAHLARAEARTGIEELVARSPRLIGTPLWREAFGTRGIAHLPVELTHL